MDIWRETLYLNKEFRWELVMALISTYTSSVSKTLTSLTYVIYVERVFALSRNIRRICCKFFHHFEKKIVIVD